MVLLEFDSTDPAGRYYTGILGMDNFEECTQMINHLIDQGWTIHTVRLLRRRVKLTLQRSLFKPNRSLTTPLLQEAKLLLAVE